MSPPIGRTVHDAFDDLTLPSRVHAPATALATAIIERVHAGRLTVDEAVPPPRPLAAKLLVAISVIEDAYDDLVRLGVLTEAHRVAAEAPAAAARWARAEVRAGLRSACRRAAALDMSPADVRDILADIQQFEALDD